MKIKFRFILLFYFLCLHSYAQQQFSVSINPISISGAPAIHSFAFAQLNGKWIFIGGRTNGLHGFEPPFAFPASGINDNIWVVDPVANQTWSASADSLTIDIKEAVTNSNMEYYQDDTMLYMVGGYGWKSSLLNFITFPAFTAVDLNGLINAVMNGASINSFFRQIVDSNLAITGAHLQKMDSTYYLVFGHRFDGRYDRSDTSGFFVQHYSNEIRKFNIQDDGINLAVTNYSAMTDTANFHRRDYNLVKQIFPNGDLGLTGFSGVFQYGIDQPFFNSVDIIPQSYSVNNTFNQNLSQYHSAVMPVYDSVFKTMHTIFFGGISEYYYDSISSLLTQDTLIPFVNTISQVTRDSMGVMSEYNLPVQMPGLLGTNAKFILLPNISSVDNEIIDLNALPGSSTLVGYIIGGILSPDQHVSNTDPTLSSASNFIFEVYIDKTPSLVPQQQLVIEPVIVKAFPNPFKKRINFEINSVSNEKVVISIYDQYGWQSEKIYSKKISGNYDKFSWNSGNYPAGLYYYRVQTASYSKFFRMVIVK